MAMDHAEIDRLRDRVERLERHMEEIYRHSGLRLPEPDPESDLPQSVVALALAGRDAEAIAEYRRLTDAGLQHAQKVVKSIRG